MAEDNSNQEPATAPELGESSAAKAVVKPAAIKTASEPKRIPVEDNSTSPKLEAVTELDPKPDTDSETSEPVSNQEVVAPPPKKDFTPPKQSGNKKKLFLYLIVVLVLAVVGYLIWSIMGKKTDTSGGTEGNQNSKQEEVKISYDPVSIAYAYKGDDKSPFTLYTRPVTGGERTAADQKLATSETVSGSDTIGMNIVVATNKAIYTSSDGGKTYKSIVKFDINEAATSVVLASDGKSVAYGNFESNNKNEVKAISLDGSDSKKLFTSQKAGVYLTGYNSQSNRIVYSEGCYNCGGNFYSSVLLRDLKTDKVTKLGEVSSGSQISDAVVNHDLTQLVYVTALNVNSVSLAGTNYAGGPYSVKKVDFATNKTSDVATFGVKNEKNANGTIKIREVHVGFIAGTNTPFYTDDLKLYQVESVSPSLIFEALKPILFIPYVGQDTIVVGNGTQTADYTLSSYNKTTKKLAKIYNGDNNTVIFGVTTQ